MSTSMRIRMAVRGSGGFSVDGLTESETDMMEAFVNGASWIRTTDDGRLEARPCLAELPPPEADPHIPPKWTPEKDFEKKCPFLAMPTPPLPDEPNPRHYHPAITIHALCGYNNTPYEVEARKLQSYGFECLRSRRGPDGRFWEIWYLPGLWYAKGDLRHHIALLTDEKKTIQAAVDFLCQHVSFGSLNVCYQRAAMVMD